MKVLKQLIKIILLTVLTLLICLLVLIQVATTTILNKNYILGQLEKTEYYKNISDEIEINFENYIAQSGFEENIMEGIVSKEKIEKDTKIILSSIYDGQEQTIDVTEIEETLRKNINVALADRNLSASQQKYIDEYVSVISNQYKETMSQTKYANQIHNIISKIIHYMELAKKGVIILMVFLVCLILIINMKKIFRGISGIGISLLSAGIMNIIIYFFIHSQINVQNILILNDAVSKTLRITILDILSNIMKNGITILVCGIIVIILSNMINSSIQKNSKIHE